ncbi:MAG: aminotransferase class V-fold PLP-dependent enzyme [Armatimonadota bacterium]
MSLTSPLARLVPWIRSQFPQVDHLRQGRPRLYLDNAAGTLVPQTVADAMADAALWANPQPERSWPAGPETKAVHRRARALLADFLNAAPEDRIYLSESSTSSLYKLRESLEPRLEGGNVVVTDCDHFANISAWEWRPRWEVRRARMLPDGHLDAEHALSLLDAQTRVVAVTQASNGLGTILKLEELIPRIRERAPEALVVIDAVHGAPHLPLDAARLGADALAFSTYKLFGPNCGVLWLRRDGADALAPFRVEPHTDPETLLEWGTLSNINVAGIAAALEYLDRLGSKLEGAYVGRLAEYPRERRRLKIALTAIREYEEELSRRVLEELAGVERVRLFGVREPERAAERVPTFAFELEGVPNGELELRLWNEGGLQVAIGSHYSAAVTRGLGREALARASFAHYNSLDEAAAFVNALRRSS